MAVGKMVAASLVVVLGLLAMTQQSMQISLNNPLRGVVDRINRDKVNYIGLILTSSSVEKELTRSGLFKPGPVPYVEISGRTYHIGSIQAANVIYVQSSGRPAANVAITAQIMADTFSISGYVHVGTAGTVNDTFGVGSVSVPMSVAYNGNWKWEEFQSSEEGELVFQKYNHPKPGKNLLGSIKYESVSVYRPGNQVEDMVDLPVDKRWLSIATQLEGMKLEACVSESNCLASDPEVVVGLKDSSADIRVKNAAYRKFLFETFGVSTVDSASGAVVLTAMSNGKKAISIRGVSNTAGGASSDSSFSTLAAANAWHTTVKFLYLLTVPRMAQEY